MSEIREFLQKYNLGFNSYSKMINMGLSTLRKYEQDPKSVGVNSRVRIETGLLVLERENHIRPIVQDIGDDISVYRGIRGSHFRNVLRYEKDFRQMFAAELEVMA